MRQGVLLSIITAIVICTSVETHGDLIAHWTLDGHTDDISGNDFNGTIHGEPVWVAEGFIHGAIQMNGLSDYVEIENYKGITGEASRTCCAWVKTASVMGGTIMSWGSPIQGGNWMFRVEPDGSLGVGIWGGYITTTTQFVNDGNWHHVAALLADDGSPDVSEIVLYIDGVREFHPYISNNQTVATGSGQNVILGARLDTDGVNYANHFEGQIGDVRIYDTPLSAEEILEAMGPILNVSSNEFEFTTHTASGNPDNQLFAVKNSGGKTLHWSIQTAGKPDWLTMTPTSGSLEAQGSETITLSIDLTDLSDGHYSYAFQVDAGSAFHSPQIMTVNLGIGDILVPEDHSTIQAAIDAAAYGDTIFVSPGIYIEDITLKNGVALVGAGDNSIIEGAGMRTPAGGRGAIFSRECDPSTLLEGFMITHGQGYGRDTSASMCNSYSNPTINNCTFSSNNSYDGGGMLNYHSNPTISNCTFSNNTATSGGGMYNNLSSPAISNCIFKDNTADYGGAIYNVEGRGSITITSCIFNGNQALFGGGIYNDAVDLIVSNCTFSRNSTQGSPFDPPNPREGGQGGALCLSNSGYCEILNCTLTGNTAYEAGGGIWFSGYGQLSLTNSILWNNSATLSEARNEIGMNNDLPPWDLTLPVIRHCDIAGCGGSGDGWNTSMGIDGGGNIDADPLFKDVNGGIDLDGFDDRIEIAGYTGVTGSGSRTCCAWVKTPNVESNGGIIASWGSPANGQHWTFRIEQFGSLGVGVWGGYITTTTQFVNDGNWHHVAAVLADDGSPDVSEIVLYIDGVPEVAPFISNSRAITTAASQNVIIGARLDTDGVNYANHFDGRLGDVMIYSRALSGSEIQQVMADNAPDNGLEGHWPLVGTTEDVSGNDRHGILSGGPAWVSEESVDVIKLDGFDDRIEVEDYKGVTGSGSRTCCAWVKTPNVEGSGGTIVSWGTPANGQHWTFRIEQYGWYDSLEVGVWGGYISTTTQLINVGSWHHVAAVLADDGSPDVSEIVLYIDGVPEVAPFISNSRAIVTAAGQDVMIGAQLDTDGVNYANHFDGRMGDVMIYSRALSGSEIRQVMADNAPGDGLEGHWPLAGNAQDNSGHGRDGMLYGGPEWISEESVDVIKLDGLDDHIEIAGYKGVTGGTSRTCCAWVKTTEDVVGTIVSWGSPIQGGSWIFRVEPDGSLGVGVWGGYIMTMTQFVNDGNWHHVAAVLADDGSPDVSEIVLYIDGVPEAAPFISNSRAIATASGQDVLIGTRLDTDGVTYTDHFDGRLGDVMIYSRPLSSSEIQQVMEGNAPGYGLEGHWPLAGTAEDVSGYSRDGILYGGPAWVSEESVDVIKLDGFDDRIEVEDYKGVNGGTSRTCCAWVKTTADVVGTIVSWGSPIQGGSWMFRMEPDGSLGVGVWGGYITTTTQFVNDGNWHHVAAVLADDGSPDVSEIVLYIDGVPEVAPFISNTRAIATVAGQDVLIGTRLDTDGVTYTDHFDGRLGDVVIYSRALSGSEIQQVMEGNAPGDGLEGHWPLAGTAEDVSGYGRDGMPYGGPLWIAEQFVEKEDNLRLKPDSPCINAGDKNALDSVDAVTLDGFDDCIEVEDYTGVTGGTSRTCCAWVKTTTDAVGTIVSWGSPIQGGSWMFRVEPDGSLGVGVWGGYITTTTQFVNDGNWHHVAAILADDGSPDVSEIVLYIDGMAEIAPFISNNRAIATTLIQDVLIGARLDTDGVNYASHFEGRIGDVMIYSRALSGSEIQQAMEGNASSNSLEGHWPLVGNANDISGHNRHGILFGNPKLEGIKLIDLDGNPRIIDGQVDIGAYEYQNARPVADAGDNQTIYAWIDGYALVRLDGTGSYDEDGDELEYFWYDGDELIAVGAEPNVVLPVGEHVFELIVNDGVEDSESDSCVITVIEAIKADAKLTPQSLNRKSHRFHVIGLLELPGDIADEIDPESMVLLPGGIAAYHVDMHGGKKNKDSVTLKGYFDNAAVMEAIAEDGDAEVTIAIKLLTGQWIYGTDVVKVE